MHYILLPTSPWTIWRIFILIPLAATSRSILSGRFWLLFLLGSNGCMAQSDRILRLEFCNLEFQLRVKLLIWNFHSFNHSQSCFSCIVPYITPHFPHLRNLDLLEGVKGIRSHLWFGLKGCPSNNWLRNTLRIPWGSCNIQGALCYKQFRMCRCS